MAITLKYFKFWPASMAVRVARRELQLGQTQINEVEIDAATTPMSAFITQQVPSLFDEVDPGGHPITVLGGIGASSYLDGLAKLQGAGSVLIPNTPCVMPLTLQFVDLTASRVMAPIERIALHGKILPAAQQSRAQFRVGRQYLKETLDYLENTVLTNTTTALVSHDGQNPFTFADVYLCAALTYIRIIRDGALNNFPKVLAYLERIEARQSFKDVFNGVTLKQNPGDPIPPPVFTEPTNP